MSIDVITSSNNIDSNCKEYNSLLEITMEMVAMPNIIPTKDWSSNLDWKMHLLHKFQPKSVEHKAGLSLEVSSAADALIKYINQEFKDA